MEMERIISTNLKKLLKEYNINQNQLAKIAGVSESTVGKWILMKSTPRMGAIQKIADHFDLPKSYILEEDKDDTLVIKESSNNYLYYPHSISAGIPLFAEAVAGYNADAVSIPDSLMGKWAGDKDIIVTRVNGDSMNNIIPDRSIIAVKPVGISELKDGDIVVFSDNGDYSVKRYFRDDTRIIFRPDSKDDRFYDYITDINNENLKIHGKVVVYIVELD